MKVEKSKPEAAPEAEDGGDSGEDEVAAPAPAPVVKKKKINGLASRTFLCPHVLVSLACVVVAPQGCVRI